MVLWPCAALRCLRACIHIKTTHTPGSGQRTEPSLLIHREVRLEEAMSFGIKHMLGRQESHWMVGNMFNVTPNLYSTPVCTPQVPIGAERKHGCLRWPERALSAVASCPLGEDDIEPFTHEKLNLPQCTSHLRQLRRHCLIYSFGIGGDARWEQYMAREHRCEVHAFDPSVKLRARHSWTASSKLGSEAPLRPNRPAPGKVFFHFNGLSTARAADATHHSLIDTSTLLSLAEVIERLNHTSSQLDVLKLE